MTVAKRDLEWEDLNKLEKRLKKMKEHQKRIYNSLKFFADNEKSVITKYKNQRQSLNNSHREIKFL